MRFLYFYIIIQFILIGDRIIRNGDRYFDPYILMVRYVLPLYEQLTPVIFLLSK